MNNNQNQPQQEEERPQMNLFQMMFLFFAIQTLMNRFMVPKPQEPSTADLLKQYNSTYALERKQDVQAPASSSPFSSLFGFAKDILPQQLGTKGKQYLSAIGKDEELNLYVYMSDSETKCDVNTDVLLWHPDPFLYNSDSSNYREMNVTVNIPESARNNGTVFAHIFLAGKGVDLDPRSEAYDSHRIRHSIYQLNRYRQNLTREAGVNLLEANYTELKATQEVPRKILSYWLPMMHMSVLPVYQPLKGGSVPAQFKEYAFDDETSTYMPGTKVNELYLMTKHYIELNETTISAPLQLSFSIYNSFKGMFVSQIDTVFEMEKNMGLAGEDDMDDLKSMFLETNIYLLILTGVVSTLHSVFDFLAFKNDIQFWRTRNNMEGLSVRTIFMNCFVNLIVLLYLMNNETSFTIILSNFVGLLIELWKVTKAVNIRFYFKGNKPVLRIQDKATYGASKTKEYDQIAMKHLMIILYPLIAGYAIYSLIYETHKSWYSWILTSLTNFVYLFGFISMTPQLFINYKLHSVAAIPTNAMIYKTLNTFIDDIFSFVIKMPTLHRIACFRDDIIFFIFLYQKWIYPVDITRKNEFGFSELDLQQANKKELDVKVAHHRTKKDRLILN